MKRLFALLAVTFLYCGSASADSDVLNDPDVIALKGYDIGFVGMSLRHTGKGKEMVALCNELLKSDPHNPDIHFEKGLQLRWLDRDQEALESYNLAIKYNRDPLGEVYYERGQCLEALGRLEEALSDFEKAIELGFDLRDAYFFRNALRVKLGYYRKQRENRLN